MLASVKFPLRSAELNCDIFELDHRIIVKLDLDHSLYADQYSYRTRVSSVEAVFKGFVFFPLTLETQEVAWDRKQNCRIAVARDKKAKTSWSQCVH